MKCEGTKCDAEATHRVRVTVTPEGEGPRSRDFLVCVLHVHDTRMKALGHCHRTMYRTAIDVFALRPALPAVRT